MSLKLILQSLWKTMAFICIITDSTIEKQKKGNFYRKRFVWFVTGLLPGVRNGKRFGWKLNIAVLNAA